MPGLKSTGSVGRRKRSSQRTIRSAAWNIFGSHFAASAARACASAATAQAARDAQPDEGDHEPERRREPRQRNRRAERQRHEQQNERIRPLMHELDDLAERDLPMREASSTRAMSQRAAGGGDGRRNGRGRHFFHDKPRRGIAKVSHSRAKPASCAAICTCFPI